jgi:hypothetical protein
MSKADLEPAPGRVAGLRTGEMRERGARSSRHEPPAVFCGT